MSLCLGIRELGLQPYEPVLEAMRRFTEQRSADSQDEIWLVEHPAVFTQGQAGKASTCWCRAISRWCRPTAAAR